MFNLFTGFPPVFPLLSLVEIWKICCQSFWKRRRRRWRQVIDEMSHICKRLMLFWIWINHFSFSNYFYLAGCCSIGSSILGIASHPNLVSESFLLPPPRWMVNFDIRNILIYFPGSYASSNKNSKFIRKRFEIYLKLLEIYSKFLFEFVLKWKFFDWNWIDFDSNLNGFRFEI